MPFYEAFCGITSSLLVAPIMTIIDTAVIKTQLQKSQLKTALSETITEYSNKKLRFGRPFGIMFFVYSSTYCTANITEYACKKYEIDYRIPTLIATSVANVSSIAYKYKEDANLFQSSRSLFPKLSYVLFAFRP